MDSQNNLFAHFFHWPSIPEYQKNLLKCIALPEGAVGQLYYNTRWFGESLEQQINTINDRGGCTAILWILNCKQLVIGDSKQTDFDFAVPFRLLYVRDISQKAAKYYINYVSGKFLTPLAPIERLIDLKAFTSISFGETGIAIPGQQKGFAFSGPNIDSIQTSNDVDLESLHTIFTKINTSVDYTAGIGIKEYPILRVKSLSDISFNQNGIAQVPVNKDISADINYYQATSHRWRTVEINGNDFDAQEISDEIQLGQLRKSSDRLDFRIKSDNLSFKVPIETELVRPFHLTKWFSLIVLFCISLVLFVVFLVLFPCSSMEIKTALAFPLVAFLLDKAWEVLSKKEE